MSLYVLKNVFLTLKCSLLMYAMILDNYKTNGYIYILYNVYNNNNRQQHHTNIPIQWFLLLLPIVLLQYIINAEKEEKIIRNIITFRWYLYIHIYRNNGCAVVAVAESVKYISSIQFKQTNKQNFGRLCIQIEFKVVQCSLC